MKIHNILTILGGGQALFGLILFLSYIEDTSWWFWGGLAGLLNILLGITLITRKERT